MAIDVPCLGPRSNSILAKYFVCGKRLRSFSTFVQGDTILAPYRNSVVGIGLVAVMLVLLTVAIPSVSVAHDIASDVTIQAFVKPEGQRLYFLVRVPLEAMQDYEFPQFDRGYIDIEAADSMLRDAAIWWIANAVDMYEDGTRLAEAEIAAVHISLPSDRSFRSYEEAFANVTGPPLPGRPQLPWEQALLDVLFEYQIENDTARYSIDPKFARLGIRTTTVLRFNAPGKPARAYQFSGDPGLVNLDPSFFQAVFRFVELGFFHILDGLDHLLFLLCLVIPIRAFRRLVPVVTSFTVAHSITLIASALGLAPNSLWFPPLVEMLIALSIVYMALENIVGANIGRRWLIAFVFGLVHGFGFSFVLRETLQFAGSHLITSLLAFNVGVEIGQLFVLALVVPVLAWGFRRAVAERMGTILLSALVAHSAWHWMSEGWTQLREYTFYWPALDMELFEAMTRFVMLLMVLAGTVWLLFLLFGRTEKPGRTGSEPRPVGE